MNDNFYRSTIFELCSRYLSRWFTWNKTRSVGQNDPFGWLRAGLEFVGQYHKMFAGLRWVIELKYASNSEFRKLETTIEAFQRQPEETVQISGSVA